MKTFLKRAAITCGVLLAAAICMGIVYIDNVIHYWRFNGGFVQLAVSNQVVMTVSTQALRSVGFNTNNTTRSWVVRGYDPATNATGNGANASVSGAVVLSGGSGGSTLAPTSASGGTAGGITLQSGQGGEAPFATTNATGGAGGTFTLSGGNGGGTSSIATNATTGGGGGNFTLSAGTGGSPSAASTNTVGGNGGGLNISSGAGGTPSAGWARKGGNGGAFTFTAGIGGSGVRTNGGNGGTLQVIAGSAGDATDGGNAGVAGLVNIVAGNGNTGSAPGTNSNGGNVFLSGGAAGSGATPGSVIVGRDSSGVANGGGFIVGISNSAVLTNVLFVRTNLNFGSVAAQASEDIPVLGITGFTNAIVSVGAPASAMVAACQWSGWVSNGLVFVRFNNYSAAPIDPGISDFEVEIKRYR